jgi:hypothetical protein
VLAEALGRHHRRVRAIGVVEQAERRLEREHAAHAGVDIGHRHQPALDRLRQAARVGHGHHVDIDAGLERQRRRLDEIAGDAVRNQLGDCVVVADQHAREAPAPAQEIAQQPGMSRERHASEVGEGRHDRGRAGADGGTERRQIDLVERAL